MELTWQQFRRQHTGIPQTELSELWTQYKSGDYAIEAITEDLDWFDTYNDTYNLLYGGFPLTADQEQEGKVALEEALTHTTAVKGYTASPTDGWTLWLGPESNALLENINQNVVFTITRQWWQKFGTGATRVDIQVYNENSQLITKKERFAKLGRLIKRYPVPYKEFRFANNINDAPTYNE